MSVLDDKPTCPKCGATHIRTDPYGRKRCVKCKHIWKPEKR